MRHSLVLALLLLLIVIGCKTDPTTTNTSPEVLLFEELNPNESGIDFTNQIENSERFNIFSYRNFYNGGGVAIGDVNNDGLSDIYFTANMGKNKLYLNKGDLQFEDITQQAGVGGTRSWSTGVVMVDINQDGFLDIYVCNAGYVKEDDQANELFINNGDGTFTEQAAKYQLDEQGYTTHAAFFDYDMDGDLDVYLLNNSFIPVNTLNYANKRDLKAEDWPVKDFLKGGGDKLLRNEDGIFKEVTDEAGIYSSLIGFGLGITVGDINDDNLPDMYVSNDFFERDYLYINQGNGTFKEDIKNWMQHISLSSMGADMADINNDGYPEVFVTEMLPSDPYRLRTTTTFENYNTYSLKLERDFYHQYMQNTLQLNNQDQTFSEIAHYSKVAASDWSWGALLFDVNNDGYRDIYVCNGVYQDVTDQDFIDFFANDIIQKMALTGEKEEMQKVIEKMPSNPQVNKLFLNNQDLTFEDAGEQNGFTKPTFSNGAAYGDLDNDGDNDLVINNLNQPSIIYRNNTNQLSNNHYINIKLKGKAPNIDAIGAKIYAHCGDQIHHFQMIPSRGFQSSIDYKMTIGLGAITQIDSLITIWPDKTKSKLFQLPVDTTLLISQQNQNLMAATSHSNQTANKLLTPINNISFEAHQEDKHIDFYQEGLLVKMLSKEGPKAATTDVNKDGLTDIFIGSAMGQKSALYMQTNQAYIKKIIEGSEQYEDTAAAFFDADGDGDQDLFVGSGGNHQQVGAQPLYDRLYLNNGKGNFSEKTKAFSTNGFNTSKALPLDYDEDGDMDLLVFSRNIPMRYGVPPRHYLYQNDGSGQFKDVSKEQAPILRGLGMVTDAKILDIDGDDKSEIIVIGEWMSPQILKLSEGTLRLMPSNLNDYSGWWYAIESSDIDQDGDQDLILGNRGENFYFKGSKEAPVKLWLNDFDLNGTVEKIITTTIDGKDMTVALKRDLTNELVSLKKQNLMHRDFANRSIQELLPKEMLNKALVKEGNYFKSAVAINHGNGQFTVQALPQSVQFSCVCGIYCGDVNNDGYTDILLGGNDDNLAPQFSKLDASFGHVLLNDGKGNFATVPSQASGFKIKGNIKQILPISYKNQNHIMVLRNNDTPVMLKVND